MKKKNLILTLCALALVAALAVGGTLAYLTDAEQTTNTFTVGDVRIELHEDNWPGNDSTETKNIVPNQEISKDPQIANVSTRGTTADQNSAMVFLKVYVPVEDVQKVADDGTVSAAVPQEIFYMKDIDDAANAHVNNFDANWIHLDSFDEYVKDDYSVIAKVSAATDANKVAAIGGYRTYVFAYSDPLLQGETTEPLFDKVQLMNVVEGNLHVGDVRQMKVQSFAIQATDILGAVAGDNQGKDLVKDVIQNGSANAADVTAAYNEIYTIVNNQATYGSPSLVENGSAGQRAVNENGGSGVGTYMDDIRDAENVQNSHTDDIGGTNNTTPNGNPNDPTFPVVNPAP